MSDPRKREFEAGDLSKRAIAEARVDGHVLRRSVTVGQDQVLHIPESGKHAGELRVAANSYQIIEEVGAYLCDCGETFENDIDAAEQHLREVIEENR